MKFSEWFSPYDLNHIIAFDEVQQTGCWPEGFLPDGLEGNASLFSIEAMGLLASAYVKQAKIDEHFIEKIKRTYDPNFGDSKLCECGHEYYRHFDPYEDMEFVGCKYCRCFEFKLEE